MAAHNRARARGGRLARFVPTHTELRRALNRKGREAVHARPYGRPAADQHLAVAQRHEAGHVQGIVFSVRPPKKSWKNIINLSGGEKTLSSLSLVFALHHFKPTPLYFMDEIDAALDFKNVSIVAHYVKEQTKCASSRACCRSCALQRHCREQGASAVAETARCVYSALSAI